MSAELLAISIRENSKIQGIKIGNSEIELYQLTDDMTCFITNIDSIIEIMNTFNKFKMCAGLKVNVEKIKEKYTGSFRDRVDPTPPPPPSPPMGSDWSSDYMETLLVNLPVNKGDLYNLSF